MKYFAYKPSLARNDRFHLMNKCESLRHMFDPREQDFCSKIIISPVEVNATTGGSSLPFCYTLLWTDAASGDSILPFCYTLLWTDAPSGDSTLPVCYNVLWTDADSGDIGLPVQYNLPWTPVPGMIAPC